MNTPVSDIFPWSAHAAQSAMSEEDARQSAAAARAISELINYAAVLWHRDKKDYLSDLRDLVDEMVWVWAPDDGADSTDAPTRLQKDCQRRITSAIKGSRITAPFSGEQVEAVVRSLSIHAAEHKEVCTPPAGFAHPWGFLAYTLYFGSKCRKNAPPLR